MAAFQFDLHLLPEASVVEMAGEVPAHLAEELACAANLWEGNVVTERRACGIPSSSS